MVAAAVDTQQPERVTTLELFFDLVFVFTLTQLTTVLFEAPNGRGLLRVVVMLGVIWWMYGGYAWMTNAVNVNTTARRLVLLAAMGSYFVLALSIPDAFGATGLAFGIAYLCVVLLHSALYTRATVASAVRAMLTLAPYNLFAALVILVGGAVGGTAQYVLWGAAGLFEWLAPAFHGASGFLVAPAHFVERHGLVVIIAIGESVVAIGFGALAVARRRLAGRRGHGRTGSERVPVVALLRRGRRTCPACARGLAAARAGTVGGACVRLLAHTDAARDHRNRGR